MSNTLEFNQIELKFEQEFEYNTSDGKKIKFVALINNKSIDEIMKLFMKLTALDPSEQELEYIKTMSSIAEIMLGTKQNKVFENKIDLINRLSIVTTLFNKIKENTPDILKKNLN